MSGLPVTKSKEEQLGQTVDSPVKILSVEFSSGECIIPLNLGEHSDRLEESTPRSPPATAEAIDLSHLSPEEVIKIRNMLGTLPLMLQGQLGEVALTENHIDLVPGIRLVLSQTNCTDPKSRKVI
eukprot:IDg13098t1